MRNWFKPKTKPRHVIGTSASRLVAYRSAVDLVIASYHLNALTATEAIEKVAKISRNMDSFEVT